MVIMAVAVSIVNIVAANDAELGMFVGVIGMSNF